MISDYAHLFTRVNVTRRTLFACGVFSAFFIVNEYAEKTGRAGACKMGNRPNRFKRISY